MRRSTSPVGPLIAVALLCVASPARADNVHRNATQSSDASSAGELYGPVDASAWSFLETPDPTVQVEDLPPPAAPVAGLDGDVSGKPLSAEERDRLGQALLSDAHDPGTAARALRARKAAVTKSNSFEVSKTGHGGVSTVVFKQPIAPETGGWKARLGAELGMAPDASAGWTPDNPLRVQRNARGANAAWASVDLHETATVDARVNPAGEQGQFATTLKRTMPIGSHLSMTLQSRTSMTETFGRGITTFDIPMMALPSPDGTTTSRVWGQDNSARFNILATGTTLGAALSSNSTDPVTHNTLSAEQKLYGPLSVSTSIHDVGKEGENRSVSARARFSW